MCPVSPRHSAIAGSDRNEQLLPDTGCSSDGACASIAAAGGEAERKTSERAPGPSAALAPLDTNHLDFNSSQPRSAVLLRVPLAELDGVQCKRAKPCAPAAKVVDRFPSFYDDCDDDEDADEDVEVEGEGGQHTVPRQLDTTPPQTEEILSALKELARARDEKLGTYLEPLVDCGAAANEDRARLARCKRGAPLTFGGC